MIKRGNIESYFISIEVDENTIETDNGFETSFMIDYSNFSLECILEIDDFNLRLNMVIEQVDFSLDLLVKINEFNINSKYLKAHYSIANSNVLISTCQLYTNSNFERVMDAILNSLVNFDSVFIEDLWNSIISINEEDFFNE